VDIENKMYTFAILLAIVMFSLIILAILTPCTVKKCYEKKSVNGHYHLLKHDDNSPSVSFKRQSSKKTPKISKIEDHSVLIGIPNSPRQSNNGSKVTPNKKGHAVLEVETPRQKKKASKVTPKQDHVMLDIKSPRQSKKASKVTPKRDHVVLDVQSPRHSKKASKVTPKRDHVVLDVESPRQSKKASKVTPKRDPVVLDVESPRQSKKASKVTPKRDHLVLDIDCLSDPLFQHKANLNYICRLCKKYSTNTELINSRTSHLIQTFYNVLVNVEKHYIYPQVICGICSSELVDCNIMSLGRKQIKKTVLRPAAKFFPHTNKNCQVCKMANK
jgi:hypothetical protein